MIFVQFENRYRVELPAKQFSSGLENQEVDVWVSYVRTDKPFVVMYVTYTNNKKVESAWPGFLCGLQIWKR